MMLSWLRAMVQSKIKTPGDLYFMVSVAEEGLVDLCGMKQLAKDYADVSGYVVLEPVPLPVAVTVNTGVIRFQVTFTGLGGHSYGAG
jgi:tripeptide aminopeptidase